MRSGSFLVVHPRGPGQRSEEQVQWEEDPWPGDVARKIDAQYEEDLARDAERATGYEHEEERRNGVVVSPSPIALACSQAESGHDE